ncbi:META domain-containing protein [Streptomyces sp. NPDC097619]|uniref:META domain-containing protein n=1 Tax=Streptomyces sp. NPDC097619 TaxID=3157228 RepID=UPI0033302A76
MPAALVAALALTACGSNSTTDSGAETGSGPKEVLSGVKWTVQSVTVGGKKTEAPAGAADLLIEGKEATGNYGCNNFRAKVEQGDGTLTVDPGPTTAMACDVIEFEMLYSKVLEGELKVATAPDSLTLTNAKGDAIAFTSKADAPAKAAPLTGTRWKVEHLASGANGDDVVSTVPGKAYFTLSADGTAEGNLGCNTFRAPATVQGDTITFGRVAATRMACTGDAAETEKGLGLLLASGPLTYKIDGSTLTLTGKDGHGLGAQAAK